MGVRLKPTRRRAAASVELILVLPILLAATLGLFQFGIFFINYEQVTLGCHNGVLEASRTPDLDITSDGDLVPANILLAISQQLDNSGIDYCNIRLEHNVNGVARVLSADGSDPCVCTINADLAPAPVGEYVRVTVCVRLNQMMPNALSFLGFNISGSNKTVEITTVMRYDLSHP